jgi:hypothetical protein
MRVFNMKPQSAPSMVVVVLALCAILAGGFALVGGVHVYQSENAAATEAVGAQGLQPVTDCFESRAAYTAINRVENVVRKYGYPNVKCSKSSRGVLWYGDPFDGTIPMGEMPEFKDGTGGDFANAVVRPREPHLTYFNMGPNGCEFCHNGKTVPFPKNRKPRLISMHQDVVENSLELKHGRGAIWCLDCHSATKRNKLVDRQGNEISFNQPQKLCGSCHGEVYIDWRAGIHGKRIGYWAVGGKKRWWVCTECHNPHTVQTNRFDPIKPEPPPPLPRGMERIDYERAVGGV